MNIRQDPKYNRSPSQLRVVQRDCVTILRHPWVIISSTPQSLVGLCTCSPCKVNALGPSAVKLKLHSQPILASVLFALPAPPMPPPPALPPPSNLICWLRVCLSARSFYLVFRSVLLASPANVAARLLSSAVGFRGAMAEPR